LVRDNPAAIVAPQLPSVLAAKAATATIPIVFMLSDDPVKHGLVKSLSRPGGNATGLSMLAAGLTVKRLQLLRELVPNAAHVGLLVNPGNANIETQVNDVQTAAHAMALEIQLLQARNDQDIEAVFAALVTSRVAALLVGADPFFNSRRQKIVDLAQRYRMPGIYEWREFVDAGGLASYGSSLTDNFRYLGIYAAKILAGTKPSD
jgi:putative ABC transport system substrate-binding protein